MTKENITNLILGSKECKKVVGDDMYWQMGLEVAPAINLRTLSAETKFLGNHLSHFPVPLPVSVVHLIWGFTRVPFSETSCGLWVELFVVNWCLKSGKDWFLKVGFEEREGNATVGQVWRSLQYIGLLGSRGGGGEEIGRERNSFGFTDRSVSQLWSSGVTRPMRV